MSSASSSSLLRCSPQSRTNSSDSKIERIIVENRSRSNSNSSKPEKIIISTSKKVKRQRREATPSKNSTASDNITSPTIAGKTKTLENNVNIITVKTKVTSLKEHGDITGADAIVEGNTKGDDHNNAKMSGLSTNISKLKRNIHSDTFERPKEKGVNNDKGHLERGEGDEEEGDIIQLVKQGNLKKRKKNGSQGKKNMIGQSRYGPEEDRTCPFCKKVFSIVTGLAYHIEHGVCRTHQNVTKQRANNSGIRKSKYSKGVVPFHILDKGDLFITDYGIVQVLADDRAPPDYGSTPFQEDIQRMANRYKKRSGSIARAKKRILANDTLAQLQRRDLLTHYLNDRSRSGRSEQVVMDKDDLDKKLAADVWSVYSIGTIPRNVTIRAESEPVSLGWESQRLEGHSTPAKKGGEASPLLTKKGNVYPWRLGPNPTVPKDCYPDRIVECVTIPDTRPRVATLEVQREGEGRISKVVVAKSITKAALEREREATTDRKDNSKEVRDEGRQSNIVTEHGPGVKLYLRRHILTSVYNPVLPNYACAACGSTFSSRMGFKNHIDGKVCKKRSEHLFKEKINQQKELAEATIEAKRRNQQRTLGEATIKAKLAEKPKTVEKKPRKRRKRSDKLPSWTISPPDSCPIYPRVYGHVGFKPGNKSRKKLHTSPGKKIYRRLSRAGKNLGPDGAVYPQIWAFLFHSISAAERAERQIDFLNPAAYRPITSKLNMKRSKKDAPNAGININDSQMDVSPAALMSPHLPPALEESALVPASLKDGVSQAKVSATVPPVIKKKKRRKGSPLIDLSAVVDVREIVKEIRNGRYPSTRPYVGNHDDTCVLCNTDKGNLFFCEYCKNSEHLECLQSKLKVQDHDPMDEFMCHHCLHIMIVRRARLRRRRERDKEDRENLMIENGIVLQSDDDPYIVTKLSAAAKAAIAIKREVVWKKSDFDCQRVSYHKCPMGGPGGLICCRPCSTAYSRFLVSTTMEMEGQSVSLVGKEVSELMELLIAAQVKLQQSMDVTNANEIRRSLLDKDEVENYNSNDVNEVSQNDQAFGIMDIFD